MRIACVYLPSFPLQVHGRLAPHRAGGAFAVTDEGERAKILVCSRAAWDEGVRPGMTGAQARALVPALDVVTGQRELYKGAIESLGEVFLHYSVTVDIGDRDGAIRPHLSIYLRVPSRSRGESFGGKLLAQLARQGYRGRVGIADDRFTAWAAAVTARGEGEGSCPSACVSVPRGEAAAFLAPLSIALLPLSDDVRHMLATLGVETLGEFAALPPPSIGVRWKSEGTDYQQLAQGGGPVLLSGFSPVERIVERAELEDELLEIEPLSFRLRPLADHVCDRLRGRGAAAARFSLHLIDRDERITEITIEPSRPTLSGQVLFDLLRAHLAERCLEHPVMALELRVLDEAEPVVEELDLFDSRQTRPTAESIDIAISRLRAVFGADSTGSPELVDSHRPERTFRLRPFSATTKRQRGNSGRRARRRTRRSKTSRCEQVLPLVMNGMSGALRLLDVPKQQSGELRSIEVEGRVSTVVELRGPTRIDSEWWTSEPIARDYYEVETDSGEHYWVYRNESDGLFYLHGIFD